VPKTGVHYLMTDRGHAPAQMLVLSLAKCDQKCTDLRGVSIPLQGMPSIYPVKADQKVVGRV
jgi:hypothetical protein